MKQTAQKITIIGSGNIGLSLAKGLVKSGLYPANSITLTRRNLAGLVEYAAQGFQISNDNAVATKNANIIVLAVLPQQVNKVLDEIKSSLITAGVIKN